MTLCKTNYFISNALIRVVVKCFFKQPRYESRLRLYTHFASSLHSFSRKTTKHQVAKETERLVSNNFLKSNLLLTKIQNGTVKLFLSEKTFPSVI